MAVHIQLYILAALTRRKSAHLIGGWVDAKVGKDIVKNTISIAPACKEPQSCHLVRIDSYSSFCIGPTRSKIRFTWQPLVTYQTYLK